MISRASTFALAASLSVPNVAIAIANEVPVPAPRPPIHIPHHPQDKRKSVEEFVHDPEVQALWPGYDLDDFRSSQNIDCGPVSGGSAVLVCDANTIVTNAHVIFENGKAIWENEDASCLFHVKDSQKNSYSSFPVREVPKSDLAKQIGTRYFGTTGQDGSDWAILKLEQPVPANLAVPANLVFLEPGIEMHRERTRDLHLLHVTGSGDHGFGQSAEFVASGKSTFNYVPYYQLCAAPRPIRDRNGGYELEIDCYVDSGASGSGLFIRNRKRLALMALVTSRRRLELDPQGLDGATAFGPPFVAAMGHLTDNPSCLSTLADFLKE